MSGIGGWVDYNLDLNNFERQIDLTKDALKKRGGNNSDVWKTKECFLIGSGFCGQREPVSRNYEGTEYIIAFDGRLYNSEKLKSKLTKIGYTFSTNSDSEIVLYSYIAWGQDCLTKFNGVFSFTVWNDNKKMLFMARDRIGVKPLFFYKYEKGLVLGSEIKTVLSNNKVPREIDEHGIASLILLGPARKCGFGVFKGVEELKPGHYAEYSGDGLKTHSYWSIKASKHTENFEDTSAHIRALIIDSIENQLVGDTDPCCFLSGGLDSSIIAVIAANKLREKNKKLLTFSIDYKDNKENFKPSAFQPDEDAPWIVEMSNFIGSVQKNIIIDTPQLINALEEAVNARDLPGMADVDSSLYLFQKAVNQECKLGLSGECSDELFGGYPWYHNKEILHSEGFPWSRSTLERSNLLKNNILQNINPLEFVNHACKETILETNYLETDNIEDRRIREMFMLNFYWFMQTLIDRNDRMSAANGVETRIPFCDYRLVEYAYNIPWEMRAYKGREKGLIRHAVQDLLPLGVAWRKKSPFPKTHNPNYLHCVKDRVDKILHRSDCRITEILDMDELRKLVQTSGSGFEKNWYGQLMQSPQVFAYLIQLEHWLRHYNVVIRK